MSETLTEQTLAVLELETGAMGCISPARHQTRWLQELQQLEQQIEMANSTSEKIYLVEKLDRLNQVEAEKAVLIVDVYKLNSDDGSAIVKQSI